MDIEHIHATEDPEKMTTALRRDGVTQGQPVAIIAAASIEYAAVFMGALRAGCVAAPLAPSSTPDSLAAMIADCGAPIVFVDADNAVITGVDVPLFQQLDQREGIRGFGGPDHWLVLGSMLVPSV